MSSYLSEHADQMVSIITNDGRNIVGILKGYDQCINIILEESFERVFSTTSGVEIVDLGLYIVRGDNIAIIGRVADDIRKQAANDSTHAEPLKPLVH